MSNRVKLHYVVNCARHGVESTLWEGKQVKVGKPLNKRDRHNSGCPFCKAEETEAKRTSEVAGALV